MPFSSVRKRDCRKISKKGPLFSILIAIFAKSDQLDLKVLSAPYNNRTNSNSTQRTKWKETS